MVVICRSLFILGISLLLNGCSSFADNMVEGIYITPPEKIKKEDSHLSEYELQRKYYQGFKLGDVN